MAQEENHAISNAKAWWAEIAEWLVKNKDADTEEIEESRPEPLSVEVRSGWTMASASDQLTTKGGEYCILLSTGGPALRIIGDLSEYNEPDNARLEWQDWGTPWTQYHCDSGPLLAYARSFYFGE